MVKPSDERSMREALRLARRGYGFASPNPMVGALVVKAGRVIGRGWHHRVGGPHAEVEAIRDAAKRGHSVRGATLFVTLEPCSTQGRTPPCTEAIAVAGIKQVVIGAIDPNPQHRGKAVAILKNKGVAVKAGVLAAACAALNEAFNHWIVRRTPFVTVKSAMTVDGRIGTVAGESKWITGERARAYGMHLRLGADAILVGVNTVLADDPSLVYRGKGTEGRGQKWLRRIVLDAGARTPLTAKIVSDEHSDSTTLVVTKFAPAKRVQALARRVKVLVAPARQRPDGTLEVELSWLLKRLGSEAVASLLVEGGGEVNASFLLQRHAHRVAFFYAPKVIGGRAAPRTVAGQGVARARDSLKLNAVEWQRFGDDFLLRARLAQ